MTGGLIPLAVIMAFAGLGFFYFWHRKELP